MITKWEWIGGVDIRDLAKTRLQRFFVIESINNTHYFWRVVGGAYILALFANDGAFLNGEDRELALNLCYAKYGGEE